MRKGDRSEGKKTLLGKKRAQKGREVTLTPAAGKKISIYATEGGAQGEKRIRADLSVRKGKP